METRNWNSYAMSRFAAITEAHSHDAGVRLRVKDVGGQSLFGQSKDAAVATVVTTADLSKMIPMPDDLTFLRSTKESLQLLERRASSLQHHVQREMILELQDAGVEFGPSVIDEMNLHAERHDLSSDFVMRKQLQFKGGAEERRRTAALDANRKREAQTREVGSFAFNTDRYQLYPSGAVSTAKALSQLQQSTLLRHQLFEAMGDSNQIV